MIILKNACLAKSGFRRASRPEQVCYKYGYSKSHPMLSENFSSHLLALMVFCHEIRPVIHQSISGGDEKEILWKIDRKS
jgi:hypothetical protein